MVRSIAVLLWAIIAASSGLTVEQRARTTHDYEVSETEHVPTASLTLSDSHDGGGGYGGGKGGFSAGSGLKTIAQGSAERANNAVANQHAAGRQAAAVAKSTLAQAAIGVSYWRKLPSV
ncbi:Protein of unknown function (DUF745) [Popillia japonica]|uniref:Secreted protein n=1 Tax=Popillia japonica TaxID=7064 RepID=A0AAW1HFD5_POPJA